MNIEPWRPRPGDLIQVWDSKSAGGLDTIKGHGQIGYVIGESKRTDSFVNESGKKCFLNHIDEGTVFKIISFGGSANGEIIHVNQNWLRPIENASDLRDVD